MKRFFDLLLALAAAVVLAIPVLLVAVLVRLTSAGSALYEDVSTSELLRRMGQTRCSAAFVWVFAGGYIQNPPAVGLGAAAVAG